MRTNLGYLGIVVKDVPATTAFFQNTLGFTLEGASPAMSQFEQEGGAVLGIQLADLPSDQPFEPAFAIENIDATCATWKARGVEIVEEPNDRPFGRTFVFRAPEGHLLRVFDPNHKAT